MSKIYYIGGSPCCGKSTVAEMISQKYDFNYYRVDDDLFDFIDRGAKDGDELLSRISAMSADELWLREPIVLHKEELTVYDKLFPYFVSKIKTFDKSKPLIVEGNALLPELMKKLGVNKSCYVYLIPTKMFQIEHYQKREWVDEYLADSSDKLQAFANWMDRDALFADVVREQGLNLGYTGFIVDGTISINDMFHNVVNALGINDLNNLKEPKENINETNKLKSRLFCGIAAFAVQVVIFFGLRSVVWERHMNSTWNFIMFVLACVVLVTATLSSKKILMAFAVMGYPVGFIIGTTFNQDSFDPGGGLLNNWWILWTVSYSLIVLLGIIIEIVVKRKQKNKEPKNDE